MKTLKRLLYFFAGIGLLIVCSKSAASGIHIHIITGQGQLHLLKGINN